MHNKLIGHFVGGGSVTLPKVLFTHLKELGITYDESFMLMELFILRYEEGVPSPSEEVLGERMGITEDKALLLLSKLIEKEIISFKEAGDGIEYDLDPFLNILVDISLGEEESLLPDTFEEEEEEGEMEPPIFRRLYSTFEGEKGTPLSPIEAETISEWLEEFHYSEDMILEALRVAVKNGAGKNLKYVDKILRDWSAKGVSSEKENEALLNKAKPKSKSTVKAAGNTKKKKKGKYDDIYFT